jgi:hypothetical protein
MRLRQPRAGKRSSARVATAARCCSRGVDADGLRLGECVEETEPPLCLDIPAGGDTSSAFASPMRRSDGLSKCSPSAGYVRLHGRPGPRRRRRTAGDARDCRHAWTRARRTPPRLKRRRPSWTCSIGLSRGDANDWRCATDDGAPWGFEAVLQAVLVVAVGRYPLTRMHSSLPLELFPNRLPLPRRLELGAFSL